MYSRKNEMILCAFLLLVTGNNCLVSKTNTKKQKREQRKNVYRYVVCRKFVSLDPFSTQGGRKML